MYEAVQGLIHFKRKQNQQNIHISDIDYEARLEVGRAPEVIFHNRGRGLTGGKEVFSICMCY